MSKSSVAVTIAGQEYKIKSDADAAWLQRVAAYVDDAMVRIREHTGTVDTRDLAVLTALNVARELITLREDPASAAPAQLRELIETATELGVKIHVCETSVDLLGLGPGDFDSYGEVDRCGVATFLRDAIRGRVAMFI